MVSDRRKFIRRLSAGTAGLSLAAPLALTTSSLPPSGNPKNDRQVLFVGDNIAVTDTIYGKVRGYLLNGIYHFLGIRYGADTSGANRFMPPQKPEPWQDVFPALWWGNSAPQSVENKYRNKYTSFCDRWNYDDVSEDCLTINVWTPGINDAKKRAVLLWLHGGGYTFGNAIEQDGYKGENLSRFGDIVFCSVNHRLGPFGFSNFAGVGSKKYSPSGNVGMLDLVASLEWIRDNIKYFGGDPANVTIMGQSGGGGKVTTLTAMPSAKGLFHKAVVLSGAQVRSGEKEYSERLGEFIIKEAGIEAVDIHLLQEMPWPQYLDLANNAARKLSQLPGSGVGSGRGFSPVVDGYYLPDHPYYPEPAITAADIPMIICSTFNEQSPSRFDASLENISLEEVVKKVMERQDFRNLTKEKARDVVNAYSGAFPEKKPVEIWSMITSNRKGVIALADSKSKQPVPVYVAWFGWQPPLFDNRMRAFHCSDICFWFFNTDLMLSHTGGGARPRKLSTKMAGSLLSFMRTGNPNSGGLPEWPKYTPGRGETMILDDKPVVRNDPDGEGRRLLP